ncbi:MAG: phage tail protein [Anaerolineae bacterium]
MAGKDALQSDPMIGAHFEITVGAVTGYFTEVSGLGSETEVVEHKIMAKGVKEPIIRKIPGRLKWGDITLKRGITANMDFYDWRKQVEQGKVEAARLDGTIIMYDQNMTPVATWEFYKGWPSKISGPSLKSDDNSVGVEELVVVHEGIKRLK